MIEYGNVDLNLSNCLYKECHKEMLQFQVLITSIQKSVHFLELRKKYYSDGGILPLLHGFSWEVPQLLKVKRGKSSIYSRMEFFLFYHKDGHLIPAFIRQTEELFSRR